MSAKQTRSRRSTSSPAAARTWTAVDRYLADLFVGPDPVLDAALDASAAANLPPINVSPVQGKLLSLLVTMTGATRVLEIGTLGGYSTIWLARGLPAGGRVVTLELDERHAAVARANIARAGFQDVVEVRVGRALDLLPQLAERSEGPFDLIFIDADKVSYPAYLDWAVRLARPGTVIVADNVVRDGAVADPRSTDESVRGVQRFNAAVAADRRLSATAVQTVGAKGYDGFALVVVGRRD